MELTSADVVTDCVGHPPMHLRARFMRVRGSTAHTTGPLHETVLGRGRVRNATRSATVPDLNILLPVSRPAIPTRHRYLEASGLASCE